MVSLARPIPRHTNTPLYIQIAEGLLEHIENGALLPNEKLPSERELSQQLGVNRMTLRQALRMLESQGLLVRRQGDGTYVAEPKIEQHMGRWLPISKDMAARGQKYKAKLLSFSTQPAKLSVARELQIGVSAPVYLINRLRFLNEEPVILEQLIMPAHLFPDFAQHDVTRTLVYDIMQVEYGIKVARVRQSLEPVVATKFEADMFNLPAGSPLLLERRLAFDADNRPLELGRDLYRGDRIRFVTDITIEDYA